MFKDSVSMAMPPLDLGVWENLGVSYQTQHLFDIITMAKYFQKKLQYHYLSGYFAELKNTLLKLALTNNVCDQF